MNSSLNLSEIESLQQRLLKHPVYDAVNDLSCLRVFMAHHVYGVWDFMSLLKHLQHVIAPAMWPWQPSANVSLRRFVNEIVLGEESDEGLPTREGQKRYASHYLQRHIQMDEESHGPLTMLLLDELCGSDPVRQAEAEAVACNAISARIRFWDGVLQAIEANVSPRHSLSHSRIGGSAR